ncbi:hypothetical protein CR513_55914, partial [Mucuna pruriens]
MTVVKNRQYEMVPMRIQNSYQVCIDYKKLNQVTRKDHFPLPFIDQVLEKLAEKSHYCFLDGFSDSHKTSGPTQDHLYMSLQNVRIYKNVVWIVQCSKYLLEVHDQRLLRPLGRLHGDLHR